MLVSFPDCSSVECSLVSLNTILGSQSVAIHGSQHDALHNEQLGQEARLYSTGPMRPEAIYSPLVYCLSSAQGLTDVDTALDKKTEVFTQFTKRKGLQDCVVCM